MMPIARHRGRGRRGGEGEGKKQKRWRPEGATERPLRLTAARKGGDAVARCASGLRKSESRVKRFQARAFGRAVGADAPILLRRLKPPPT